MRRLATACEHTDHRATSRRLCKNRRNDDCPFCVNHLTSSSSEFDHVLAVGPGVNLLPALGMLVPGYLLVATTDHILSMAELDRQSLRRLSDWVDDLCATLSPWFGEYVVFEHGSTSHASGACIDHAHLHLIPAEHQFAEAILRTARWEVLRAYEDKSRLANTGYAYLRVRKSNYVLRNPQLGSQWIRRQLGSWLNRDDWDWAINDGRSQLSETLELLEHIELPHRAGEGQTDA